MKSRILVLTVALVLLAIESAPATVYRMMTGDYTTINPDWSAYENGYSFDTVESGTPSQPLISTQHYAGVSSVQIQVPTDNTGNKERFEYVIAHAADSDGLHFDNARYCGFAFRLGSPAAAFSSSDLFWQAWQGSPWGPPASLKLTADSSAPFTIGLYVRNMATGPDSANPDIKLWSSAMIQPDTWYSVVIYISPRYTNNAGNIKLWINGTNYVDCTTNIGYDPSVVSNALNGLDIKNGIYQPNANNGHTMFFDQIMFADTYAEASAAPLPVNAPPTANPGSVTILRNTFADVDLAGLASDSQTVSTQCLYTVTTTNGTAVLLADGHTARITPATKFLGTANYSYTVTDNGEDPREFLHYSFEPPDTKVDGFASDNSGNFRDGQLQSVQLGLLAYSTNVPFARYNSTSLQVSNAPPPSPSGGGARLLKYVSNPAEFNFSDSSWTFGGWFQRANTGNNDFIFYMGSGDGFGGDGDELQFYCSNGAATLAFQHYNIANALDASASSPATATSGQWHHAALVFQRTNSNAGVLSAYLDGAQFAATNVTWSLPQQTPIVFGGHNKTNSNIDRWFNGWLDDLVLFTNALSASEISRLATRTVGQFGGFIVTNSIVMTVTNYAPPLVSNPGVSNGAFLALVDGDAEATYEIQRSSNLLNWDTWLTTNPAVLPFSFADPMTDAIGSRFYRVKIGP